MRNYLLKIILLTLLCYAGCDEISPDVIKNAILSDEDNWLERDVGEDPYELVNDQCCNDYYPKPLPMDTEIQPVISPARDLDYFNLQIPDTVFAGQIFLSSERDNLELRLFTRDLDEFELLPDSLGTPMEIGYGPTYLTTLARLDTAFTTFTLLVKGETKRAQGAYVLHWQEVIPTTDLDISRPAMGEQVHRSHSYIIRWSASSPSMPVTVALMKGPGVLNILKRDQRYINSLSWTPTEDLDPGNDYRVIVYQSDNPNTLDISDAFEID
ncbi:Ser-Thr-rich GPI-anchored membrane family protein [Candidatus Neomarinimicrobiota bacterium]